MAGLLKRLFVGRPLASDEQEHQRLPKALALPIFSSDAISSTAYATEEILFVTALGASSLTLGLERVGADRHRGRAPARHRRDQLPPDDLRLPGRRRLLHRQPREPRRDAVAPGRRVDPGRLRAHRRRVDLGRRRRAHLDSRRSAAWPTSASCIGLAADRGDHDRQPARPQGVRTVFAIPTYSYIAADGRTGRATACSATYFGHIDHVRVRPRTLRGRAPGRRRPRAVPDPQGLLVGRGRAHRRRGDLRRRARVPQAGVEERRHHARCAMAVILGTLFIGTAVLAHHLQPYPSHDETVLSQMGRAVLRQRAALRRAADRDRRDPHARGQHRVRRLPAAESRSSPATAICRASSARQGDRLVFSNGILFLAGAAGAAARRLRRQDQRADPALRRRRVHQLHAEPARHGALPPQAHKTAGWQLARRDQRHGRRGHLRRAADRGRHQVHQRRVGAARRRAGDHRVLRGHQASLRVARSARSRPGPRSSAESANTHTVVIPVGRITKGTLAALDYAELVAPQPHRRGVPVASTDDDATRSWTQWARVPASTSRSRSSTRPIATSSTPFVAFLDELDDRWGDATTTVVIPEFVVNHWYEQALHNQTAARPQAGAALPAAAPSSRRCRTTWSAVDRLVRTRLSP